MPINKLDFAVISCSQPAEMERMVDDAVPTRFVLFTLERYGAGWDDESPSRTPIGA